MDFETAKKYLRNLTLRSLFLGSPSSSWGQSGTPLTSMSEATVQEGLAAASAVKSVYELQALTDKKGCSQITDEPEYQATVAALYRDLNTAAEDITIISRWGQVLKDDPDVILRVDNDTVDNLQWIPHRLLVSVAYRDKDHGRNVVAECGTSWPSQLGYSIGPATLTDLRLPDGTTGQQKKLFHDYYTHESGPGKGDSPRDQTLAALTKLTKNGHPFQLTGHSLGTTNLCSKAIDLLDLGCKDMRIWSFSAMPSMTREVRDLLQGHQAIRSYNVFTEHDFAQDFVGPYTLALGLANTLSASIPKDSKARSLVKSLIGPAEDEAVRELCESRLVTMGTRYRLSMHGNFGAHQLDGIVDDFEKFLASKHGM